MRKLTEFPSQTTAQALGDYLTHSGIRMDVEDDGGTWSVWVVDEDHMEQAQALAAAFAENPDADEILQTRGAQKAEVAKLNKLENDYNRRIIKNNQRKQITTPVTYVLIGLSILFYFLQSSQGPVFELKMFYSSMYHPSIQTGESPFWGITAWQSGEVWRLVTPIFLHFGLTHILFNMMWLHFFGRQLEIRLGSRYMVVLVLVLAVLSNSVQYWHMGPNFGGMSGVNYGLFGYILLRKKFDPLCGLFIDRTNTILMLGWFVFCFVAAGKEVANAAHAGGLVIGALWGYISALRRRKGRG